MIKKNFKKKSKVLIFVLAYNAEKTISETIKRLPLSDKNYDLEILIVDDASSDNTFIKAKKSKKNNSSLKVTILRNPVNQGYGGNVKIGFMHAIKNDFGMEAANKKLSIWDSVLGDFNEKGLRGHDIIKIKKNRPQPMMFNMNY